jgi:hypothetical protein
MKHSKSKLRKLLSGIFALLLTLLFFILFVCLGLSMGVFNDTNMIRKIKESNYYTEVYKVLDTNTKEVVYKAGLPTAILNNVISQSKVYVDGNNYMNTTLSGNEEKIDTEKLKTELRNNIDEYLSQKKIIKTDDLNVGIEKMISVIDQEYQSCIKIEFLRYYAEYRNNFQRIMKILIPVVIILIGIMSYFSIRIRHYKHRGVRYITYALISSSIMTIFSSAWLLISGKYMELDVKPEFYKSFITSCLEWDIWIFIYLGIIGLILSMMLMVLTGYLKKMNN